MVTQAILPVNNGVRGVLRSRTASGEYVTLGTASLKDKPFASLKKVLATRRVAHEAATKVISKHREEILAENQIHV